MQVMEDYGHQILTDLRAQADAYQCPEHSVTLRDKTSVYKVSSALQKCIRRGLSEEAVFYAQGILNSTETEYLWRRLPVIALEDIGIANPLLCAQVLHFCRFKEARLLISQKRGLSMLVERMASGLKSRTMCDMVCSVAFMKTLPEVETWQQEVQYAMTSAGWKPEEPGHPMAGLVLPARSTEAMVMQALERHGPAEAYMVYAGSKKSVYHLHATTVVAMDMLSSEPAHELVLSPDVQGFHKLAGVPEWAFDQHTLDGKRALGHVLKSSAVLKEWSATWETPLDTKILGMALFQVESALLDRSLVNPQTMKVQRVNDLLEGQHVGLNEAAWSDLLKTMQGQQFKNEMLYSRKRVLGVA